MRKNMFWLGLGLLSATVLSGCGDEDVKPYIPTHWTTFQPASQVIGQPDGYSNAINQGGAATANTLYGPATVHVAGGRLWVGDSLNYRLLSYDPDSVGNNPAALGVQGQPDFITTAARGISLNPVGVYGMFGLGSDGTNLMMTDRDSHRVLVWNTAPMADDTGANYNIGKVNTSTCDSSTLANPNGFIVVGGKLILPDGIHHRLLIWNTVPANNTTAADLVLGQADFVSCLANRGGTPALDSMNRPNGAWSDGTRLFVTDLNNNRVLVWNAFPTAHGQAADFVLGNAGGIGGTDINLYSNPAGVTSDGTRLAVSEWSNHRVLIWNSIPIGLGDMPSLVLGQPDFTTGLFNAGGAVAPNTFNSPGDLRFHNGKLYVPDYYNNRVLVFAEQ